MAYNDKLTWEACDDDHLFVLFCSLNNASLYCYHFSSSLHIQWAGFLDPQSGIDHFEACVGTRKYICDVVPYFTCMLQSSIIKTGLNLPLGQHLYVTVTAFNKAKMNVSASSNGFIVDTTPPVVEILPTYQTDYTSVSGSFAQWDKSIIRVFWKFRDNESPISRQIVSLLTHHEGHTPIEHYELGPENKLTIAMDGNNRLHDGDKYSVLVISCNAADLCTTARSADIVIDSTPPHLGGFKPPLTWQNTGIHTSVVNLTWYGFVDQESGIDTFYLTVSKSYTEQELTKGVVEWQANTTLQEYQASVSLFDAIQPDDELILSVWAKNNAGLNSSIARVTVSALSTSVSDRNLSVHSGLLELQKHSCDIHFCNKDCTCAVVGQPCLEVSTNQTCSRLNMSDVENQGLPIIDVSGSLDHKEIRISASSACLSGSWKLRNDSSLVKVRRFEYGLGLKGQPVGEGIVDLKTTIPWQDVGKRQETVYCLSGNQTLIHDDAYVIYVRVWYDTNTFAQFESLPIHIDHTPPKRKRGGSVKDSNPACIIDYDFIDWNDTITACWNKAFSETQGKIIFFSFGLGTSPGCKY